MRPSFRTAEEYYRDTELNEFEISEFEFKFLSELEDIDFEDFEEVKEVKEVKFDFGGYEKSYYFYLNKYLNSFEDHYGLQYVNNEINDFKKLYDLLVNVHNNQIKSKDFFFNIIRETISSSIRYFFIVGHKYHSLLHPDKYQKTIASIQKIIDFLEFKLSEINMKSSENIDKVELVDFSELGITEKVIFLSRLGVLDFLKKIEPFSTSNNSLASVVSAFTGGKTSTIQPMINPMFSKQVDDSKNPMNSKKTVLKVDQKLISIGFKIKNTN